MNNRITETVKPSRLEYIDCMRGFTMLLVVYCHVLTNAFCVEMNQSIVNSIGLKWRMPMFFFVSGFVACTTNCDAQWLWKRLKKRTLNQFLPTFVTGSMYLYCVGWHIIRTLKYDMYKGGYWFTVALFEVFVIFAFISYLMHTLKIGRKGICVTYAFVIALDILLTYQFTDTKELDIVLNIGRCQIFIVERLLLYMKYFFLGAIAKLYYPTFKKIVENYIVSAIALVTFVVALGKEGILPNLILGVTGIFVVFNFFLHYQHTFSSQTIIGRILSTFGKNTLQIYFLHYFFTLGMSHFWNPAIVRFITSNWFVELCVVIPISIVITISCLVADKCIQSVPIIHTLLFGPSAKNNNSLNTKKSIFFGDSR